MIQKEFARQTLNLKGTVDQTATLEFDVREFTTVSIRTLLRTGSWSTAVLKVQTSNDEGVNWATAFSIAAIAGEGLVREIDVSGVWWIRLLSTTLSAAAAKSHIDVIAFRDLGIKDSTAANMNPPVGSVVAWLKSFTNTPALPDGWVECDGTTLDDPQSVYDGQVIPDLIGGTFLRGSQITGGTGGTPTHTLTTSELPAGAVLNVGGAIAVPGGFGTYNGIGGGQPHENLPPYYNVVWIMRVR